MSCALFLLICFVLLVQLDSFHHASSRRLRQSRLRLIAQPEGNIPKRRVLSGIQPSGNLHIGNYLGAMKYWAENQDYYENFFSIVDLHAVTVAHDPKQLRQQTLEAVAWYLAAGIDPKKSKIFVQSHVKGHCELGWLLNCITPMTWVQSMHQYKEKSTQQGSNIVSVGLLDYPVLMAADILLYKAHFVPVGYDQKQHLNLVRAIAHRFYHLFCEVNKPVFPVPEILMNQDGCRVMSLEDGNHKMSKSAPNDGSRINLNDSPDVIRDKIRLAKTDSILGLEFMNPDRPECTSLLNLYRAVGACSVEQMVYGFKTTPHSQFKPLLAEAIIEHLAPIQKRYSELIADEAYLNTVLAEGREAAEVEAEDTLKKVKDVMGFYPVQKAKSSM